MSLSRRLSTTLQRTEAESGSSSEEESELDDEDDGDDQMSGEEEAEESLENGNHLASSKDEKQQNNKGNNKRVKRGQMAKRLGRIQKRSRKINTKNPAANDNEKRPKNGTQSQSPQTSKTPYTNVGTYLVSFRNG
jgi:hypothetical protein